MNPRQRSETTITRGSGVGVTVSGVDESSSEVGNYCSFFLEQYNTWSGVDESSSEVGNPISSNYTTD